MLCLISFISTFHTKLSKSVLPNWPTAVLLQSHQQSEHSASLHLLHSAPISWQRHWQTWQSTLHDERAMFEPGLRQVQSSDLLLQSYQARRTRFTRLDTLVDQSLQLTAESFWLEYQLDALAVFHLTHILLHVGRTTQLPQVLTIITVWQQSLHHCHGNSISNFTHWWHSCQSSSSDNMPSIHHIVMAARTVKPLLVFWLSNFYHLSFLFPKINYRFRYLC